MSQPPGSHQETIFGYQQKINGYETAIRKLKQSKKVLAIARLAAVLAGLGVSWFFWPVVPYVFSGIVLFVIIFIFLVFRDADRSTVINNHERLIRVNQHEIDAIRQNLEAYDDGLAYADASHPYASDLDLFGKGSLYQWLNRCHADQSKKLLASYLKTPLPATTIKEKQEAAKELSGNQAYCQQFQSTSMAAPLTDKTERKLKMWMAFPSAGFENSFWISFQNIYPILPFGVFTLYILDIVTFNALLYFLAALYIFHFLAGRKMGSEFELLQKVEPEMDTMHKQLNLIEKEVFKSDCLQSLQNRLKPSGYASASASIRDLNTILKKIDWRSNLLLNAIFQLFFFWDLRIIILLKEWKRKNKNHLQEWIRVIAEKEVMISLSSLVYNEPEWCFPEVDEKYFHLSAVEIGHPLIPAATRITNDFKLEGTGKIALITGSNMAGKSTFLRSLGVNTAIGLMGAPVCARSMSLCEVKLVSSMRVADNLTENTSTFYAELKKLQYIIEAVNRKEEVFILLDEVLRGTNSTDRHKGSRALVRQLLQSKSVAVMATHDTELAHSESAADESVSNYHFEGKIIKDQLHFDYKIKNGICESLNATALMKKIGIHFQD